MKRQRFAKFVDPDVVGEEDGNISSTTVGRSVVNVSVKNTNEEDDELPKNNNENLNIPATTTGSISATSLAMLFLVFDFVKCDTRDGRVAPSVVADE